jgi:hypothetical protein
MYQRTGNYTPDAPQPPRHDAVQTRVESVKLLPYIHDPQKQNDRHRKAEALHKVFAGELEAVVFAIYQGHVGMVLAREGT